MKKKLRFLFILTGLCAPTGLIPQSLSPGASSLMNQILVYDLSSLWTKTESAAIYGFIGVNCQRLQMKFLRVEKDPQFPTLYYVKGKSKVKDNTCNFEGRITIVDVKENIITERGADDLYVGKVKRQGTISGTYTFREDSTQEHSGFFTGTFETKWYIDMNNKIHYDDIENYSDRYCNNQFSGWWTSHDMKTKLVCNWGDWRVPGGKERGLDWGAG